MPVRVSNWCLSFFLVPSRSSNTPLYPSKVLRARELAPTFYSSVVFCLDSHLNPLRSWEHVTNPTDVHTLKSFIRLCNYYKIYVQDFNTSVHPFYALLKKDVAWTWNEKAQEAFNTLKEKFSKFPILRRPDFSKVFILHINRSAFGIGAIIRQLDEESKKYVIAYVSRSNKKAEINYSSYEGECLAIVWAVIHFRPYLFGTKFTLYTNHQPIQWLMTNDKLIGKLVCWALILQEYDSRLFTNLVLHIRMQIPCHGDPSLPLKISQKPRKTSTKF